MTEQPTLPGLPKPRVRRTRAPSLSPAAASHVARVAVDIPVAHLDRTFEYLVPETLDGTARPGVRVRVRFAGQDVQGYLLGRSDEAEHRGALTPLRTVVGTEQVLTPEVLDLARAVADRYAGTLADVLRLAVPPRHARVENEAMPEPDATSGVPRPTATAWEPYRGGPALINRMAAGESPRAVWTALPSGPTVQESADAQSAAEAPQSYDWADAVAQAVLATAVAGRGSVVVVPDGRDVDRVCAALERCGIPPWRPGAPVISAIPLRADLGPAPRYRAFLAALRGRARVVVGTRAAAFAPVPDLGLVVCWDDGDDALDEPRAPYPSAREVLTLRATRSGAAAIVGGHTRTVEAALLVRNGWARPVEADRATVRARTPRVRALTSVELAREGPAAAARLPGEAWRVARTALADGPVLVQVPRGGYVPTIACGRCRTLARCSTCHGPLALPGGVRGGVPQCRWCGALAGAWRCPECHGTELRAVRVGSERTAEELGRAFPGVRIRTSGSRHPVLDRVDDRPALVVATPGAEPVADGGYVAALLLDAAVAAARSDLRGAQEALRRWLRAAALVRPQPRGTVLLVGDGPAGPTQALVRWDPAGFAERELDERRELGLPPAVRLAVLTGAAGAVRLALDRLVLPPGADVLGPVAHEDGPLPGGAHEKGPLVQAQVRAPYEQGDALSRALAQVLGIRSARKEPGVLRVEVDPHELW